MKLSEIFLRKIAEPENEIIKLIQDFHRKKFNNVDLLKQERKFLCEMAEFQSSVNKEEKIEEAVDVIISAIGFIDRSGCDVREEVLKKFCKVLDREYPDNFQHKEE